MTTKQIVLLVFGIFILIWYIPPILYDKFGWFKWFYHNILGWHVPDDEKGFDGCSFTSHCKYCDKEIMQDSQGNWF